MRAVSDGKAGKFSVGHLTAIYKLTGLIHTCQKVNRTKKEVFAPNE